MTQIQSVVAEGLTKLGLETKPPSGGIVGGPTKMEVTEQTLKLLKAGTLITVASDGTVTIE